MRSAIMCVSMACLVMVTPASAQEQDIAPWVENVGEELSRIRVSYTMATLLMRCCKADRDEVEGAFQNARQSVARTKEAASQESGRLCGSLTFLGLGVGRVRTRLAILHSKAKAQNESAPLLDRIETYKNRVAALAQDAQDRRSQLGC